tara:strand:- start:495 stop:719 length:225 start_codon:yes stop_codon:yes gene_type:complete
MDPALLEILTGVLVALLGGDRLIQGVRARRNGNAPATRRDVEKIRAVVTQLQLDMEGHLSYHKGYEAGKAEADR